MKDANPRRLVGRHKTYVRVYVPPKKPTKILTKSSKDSCLVSAKAPASRLYAQEKCIPQRSRLLNSSSPASIVSRSEPQRRIFSLCFLLYFSSQEWEKDNLGALSVSPFPPSLHRPPPVPRWFALLAETGIVASLCQIVSAFSPIT